MTRVTVTLWARDPDGGAVGISEFLLDDPDERRFLQRTEGLFKMAPAPGASLFASVHRSGHLREVEAGGETPEEIALRLWQETCTLPSSC